MKKSSLFVTMFLIVTLIFAVSCSSNDPSIDVTTQKTDLEANIKTGDLSFSVEVAIANDTFNSEVVKANADVKSWFTISDSTKADVKTATVKTDLDEKKDKVTVDVVVEPKAVTETDKSLTLTVAIPEAKETVYTTSKKAVKEAKANAIKITVIDQAEPTAVTGAVSGDAVVFTAGTEDQTGTEVKVTLTGGTFASTTDVKIISPNVDTEGDNSHITFDTAIDSSNIGILNITVKATSDVAAADGGTYKINIPESAITPSDSYKAVALSLDLPITVNAQ